MKGFDLIDSASFGYKTVWQERKYLVRLAAIPIVIKLICTVLIFALGYEENYLRQGLVALPGLFAEGWLAAQFLRTLLTLERWPIMLPEQVTDQQMSALLLRARGIMSATILFVLINFLAYGFKWAFTFLADSALPPGSPAGSNIPTDSNPIFIIPALALIAVSIWIFRYMWLYMPVVVLMPIGDFLKKIGGFMASIRMMGVFLVAVIPCLVLAIVLSNVAAALVGGADSDVGRFVIVIISVLVETLITVLTTASMAYALRFILPRHPKALPDINKP